MTEQAMEIIQEVQTPEIPMAEMGQIKFQVTKPNPPAIIPELPAAASSIDNTAKKESAKEKAERVYTEPAKRRGRPPGSGKPKPPTFKPEIPDFDEWETFIGGLLIRWLARAYVAVALSGLDRNLLTPDEKEDLELDDDALSAVAKPFAHLASKSKFNKKYGRTIMESRDAIEASVILFMWAGRIGRIKTKYMGKHRKEENNVNNRFSERRQQRIADSESSREILEEQAEATATRTSFGNGVRPTGVGYN